MCVGGQGAGAKQLPEGRGNPSKGSGREERGTREGAKEGGREKGRTERERESVRAHELTQFPKKPSGYLGSGEEKEVKGPIRHC